MKAIILAAGYNRRLADTIEIPKPLLKIGSKTILKRQIDLLVNAGFNKKDIFVVVGYKHEMIREIHDNIILNKKYVEYDNAYSVYLGLKYLLKREDFDDIFIFDGDLIYNKQLIDELVKSKEGNLLVNREVSYSKDLKNEISIIKEDNEIIEMIIPEKDKPLDEKYKDKQLFSFLGILKLQKEKAKEFEKLLENPKSWKKWYGCSLLELINRGGFYNLPLPKELRFCSGIDTQEDYIDYKILTKFEGKNGNK